MTLYTNLPDSSSWQTNGWLIIPAIGKPVYLLYIPISTQAHWSPDLTKPCLLGLPTSPPIYCAVESTNIGK